MKRERHPCGCVSTEREWLSMGAQHQAEHDETHSRWAREHQDGQRSSGGVPVWTAALPSPTAGPAVTAGHL